MDFFRDLREAASTVEKSLQDVYSLAEQRQKGDDLIDKTALVLLKDKKEELKKTRIEASALLKSLRGEVPFVQLVKTCEHLVEKNLEILNNTEVHLQQYGFKPRAPTPTKTIPNNTSTKGESSDNKDESLGSENTEEVHGDSAPSTPESSVCPESPDLSRTPKLMDFGLSEATMRMLSKNDAAAKTNQQDTNSLFKVPLQPPADHGHKSPSRTGGKWSDGVVPDVFEHDGVLVTPGLMAGISSVWTPTPSNKDKKRQVQSYHSSPVMSQMNIDGSSQKMSEKELHSSKNNPEATINLSEHISNDRLSDDNSDSTSPIPPILTGPGVRQIQKTIPMSMPKLITSASPEDSPIPPTLMTPGLKPIQKRPLFMQDDEKEVAQDTPEAPQLMTPGIKQIHRRPPNPDVSLPPQPQLLSDHTSKNISIHSLAHGGHFHDGDFTTSLLTTNNDLVKPNGEHSSTDSSFLSTRPVLQSADMYDTPELPQLTFPLTAYLTKNDPLSTPSRPTETKTQNPDVSIPDRSLVCAATTKPVVPCIEESVGTGLSEDICGTLQVPQLSSLSKSFTAVLSSPTDKENLCPNQHSDPPADRSQNHTALFTNGTVKPSFPEEVHMCVYVPLLSEEEYKNQPDYMQRTLDYDKLNACIRKINMIVAGKIQAEEQALVSEADLRKELDTRQMGVFFLCLMRLERLTMTRFEGQKYYTIP